MNEEQASQLTDLVSKLVARVEALERRRRPMSSAEFNHRQRLKEREARRIEQRRLQRVPTNYLNRRLSRDPGHG